MKSINKKIFFLSLVSFGLFAGSYVFAAASFSSEVSVNTPKYGGIVDVRGVRQYKYRPQDGVGSIYATYQKTALKHQARLAYSNISGGLSKESEWATMEVNVIKHPELVIFEQRYYFSQAKSHNFEFSNNTLIKYKYSPDNI